MQYLILKLIEIATYCYRIFIVFMTRLDLGGTGIAAGASFGLRRKGRNQPKCTYIKGVCLIVTISYFSIIWHYRVIKIYLNTFYHTSFPKLQCRLERMERRMSLLKHKEDGQEEAFKTDDSSSKATVLSTTNHNVQTTSDQKGWDLSASMGSLTQTWVIQQIVYFIC